jgi:predicted O-methyltransferase YrrM
MFNFKNKFKKTTNPIIINNSKNNNNINNSESDKYQYISVEDKNKIQNIINQTKDFINNNLLSIINGTGEKLEGNIFMIHETTTYINVFFDKQINFILACSNYNINSVLEIGFNAGFSTLLMLFSNPNLKITCVDICSHKYTSLCFNKIKEFFGDRIDLLRGSSVNILPQLIGNKFDLIHIDGCHLVNIAEIDIKNSLKLCKSGTILIMDDTDNKELLNIWLKYTNYNKLLSFFKGNFIETKYHNIKVYP